MAVASGPAVAMHIQDGIIDLPVSAAWGGIAVVALAVCLARARRDLDERLAPMAGLVAAFIFAVQMLTFPVLPGVSGHLLGGTLAVILVGPWVGTVCIALVLIVQSLVYADGGLTALGLNVVNMGVIGVAVGYVVVRLLLRLLPDTRAGLAVAAFVASVCAVVVASQGFVLEYALGGSGSAGLGKISLTLAGVHLLIGIGEGFVTAVTVTTVAAARPDLVWALRGRRRPLTLRTAPAPAAEGAA